MTDSTSGSLYCNEDAFKEPLLQNTMYLEQQFSVFHLNGISITNKQDEIITFLDELNYRFENLAFTETWLSGSSDEVIFSGYKAEVIFRTNRRGGGVPMYFRNETTYHIISEYSVVTRDYESRVKDRYLLL